ncbi:hypothetical protein C8R44DRAFT_640731 [Mycena epipterygia]|nr:hypothetical protein C8R44DRAFT_640731 [Mycena epipterygia]
MSRFAVFSTMCSYVMFALASPLQQNNANTALEKRITHIGNVIPPSDSIGNCGFFDPDSAAVVARSKARYDDNGGTNCNQIHTPTDNSKVVYSKTRDSCEAYDMESLDLSPSLFEQFSTLNIGDVPIRGTSRLLAGRRNHPIMYVRPTLNGFHVVLPESI